MDKGIIEYLVKSNEANIKSIKGTSGDNPTTIAEDSTKEYIEQLERENKKLKTIIKMLLEE